MRLTKDNVTALVLPAGKNDHIEWDESLPGFGVRLRTKTKSWVVQYRVGRQQRRESLGDVRKVEIDAARRIARQLFAKAELGIDPAAEKAKANAEATATALTLGRVADLYLERKEGSLRPRTYDQAKLHLETHWKALRGQPMKAINRADIAMRLAEMTKERGKTAAARARGNLSALFTWAMKEGLCEANPVLATNDPSEGIEPRDRVLSPEEIKAIWTACEEDDFGRIVKLLLLTGCRREEIGGLKWSEINLDTGVMTIPGERTKNHRALVMALPAAAIHVLEAAHHRADRDYIFGGRGGAFSAWSYCKLGMDAKLGRSVAPWRLHDLRRTAATQMAELGVQPHIIEAILNHSSGHKAGVAGIYNRATYQREIKAALALWADQVRTIIENEERKLLTFSGAA